MFENLLESIQSRQMKKFDEISFLKDDFMLFQKQFVEGIQSFISLAKREGIVGVEVKQPKHFDNGVTEYHFQMGDVNYVLVTNDNIEKLRPDNRKYGNYSFVFFEGSDNSNPFVRISVYTNSEDKKYYSLNWFNSDQEIKHITGSQELIKDSGITAAKILIEFLYSGDNYLREAPTLEAFHKSASEKGKLGFPIS